MGLLVSVYRSGNGDCTNNGMSAKVTKLCLVNVEGPFNPSEDAPAALLVKNDNLRQATQLAKIVPADGHGMRREGWFMFGGNYAACSDSRFGEAMARLTGIDYASYAVPIHDRQE